MLINCDIRQARLIYASLRTTGQTRLDEDITAMAMAIKDAMEEGRTEVNLSPEPYAYRDYMNDPEVATPRGPGPILPPDVEPA